MATRSSASSRSLDVLVALAMRAPGVVGREDLMLEVWGERAVSDAPLTRCIGELRRALGDTRGESAYIATILAWLSLHHDWDIAAARMHIDHALEFEPANHRVISYAATVELELGNLDTAVRLREQVVAMDPLSRGGFHQLGVAQLFAGDFEKAETMFRQALTISPDYLSGNYFLGQALLLKGDAEGALVAFRSEPDEAWNLEGRALAHFAMGQFEESDTALKQLIDYFAGDMTFQIGETHAFRGEADDAFEWLDRAYEGRDGGLWAMYRNPLMSRIQDDPRWGEMLKTLGIEE